MNQYIELQDVLQAVIEKSLNLLTRFEYEPDRLSKLIQQWNVLPKKTFITHGEPEAASSLKHKIELTLVGIALFRNISKKKSCHE